MGGIKRLQHGPAQGRQPFTTRRAALFGRSQGGRGTCCLIMGVGTARMIMRVIGMVMVVSHDVFYHGL